MYHLLNDIADRLRETHPNAMVTDRGDNRFSIDNLPASAAAAVVGDDAVQYATEVSCGMHSTYFRL
ncbi:MAG: hypothetical protein WAX14_17410 [Rhodococcus sp. (in: high G+C Gram-positive bacteria)]|uniref:hypothetical protein n=1 Tax=Rhodococcus sp. TaxID=1831 RepID=UPI003BB80069